MPTPTYEQMERLLLWAEQRGYLAGSLTARQLITLIALDDESDSFTLPELAC